MAKNSAIEWTDATWNPWYGCRKVSAGCKICYMYAWAKRSGRDPMAVTRSKTKFHDPLKWREPRMIFTCSLSDFFIEEADAWRDEAFAVMALTPQHTYQVLTKRPDRMRKYLTADPVVQMRIAGAIERILRHRSPNPTKAILDLHASKLLGMNAYDYRYVKRWPLPNVWLGVSVEDQKTADERIPLLAQTPAAKRFISAEPLLGPIDFFYYGGDHGDPISFSQLRGTDATDPAIPGIDWVIVGGESGPNARPSHPDWFRSIRDQCLAQCKDCAALGAKYAVSTGPGFKDDRTHWATCERPAFFFKQWGEWAEYEPGENRIVRKGTPELEKAMREADAWISHDGRVYEDPSGLQCHPTVTAIVRPGKKRAGRLLDGREWNELPEVSR